MCVIIITVITQGVRVPAESRGDFRGLLFVSDGFFQAVGVISFGIYSTPTAVLLSFADFYSSSQHSSATTTRF